MAARWKILCRSISVALMCGVLMCLMPAAAASSSAVIAQARRAAATNNATDRETQTRVDAIDKQVSTLAKKYRDVLQRKAQLDAYASQVKPLLQQQKTRIGQLEKRLAKQGDMAQQLLPLMLQMANSLAKFVKLDLPFLQQERKQRIANLRQALADSALPLAKKFQRIAQAYQVEADYGRSLGHAQRDIVVGGQHKRVDMLRVGRVALLYETPDGNDTGYWDAPDKRWVTLDGAYARTINTGLRMARGDLSAAPLVLPIPLLHAGGAR